MSMAGTLQSILALAFVLALIGGGALVARRSGLAGAGAGADRRRLAVIETLALDSRRRLVLVRRDGVEHLLLLGSDGARVVERAIAAPVAAAPAGETRCDR
jgi:flagellar protein FliO/FliZ